MSAQEQSDICEVLQILAVKWSYVVLDELLNGTQRFSRLRKNVAIVNSQSLTDTLRYLEHNGLVRRQVFPTVPVSVEYSLTDKGREFQMALKEMGKWVQKWGASRHVAHLMED